ncbi:MAG: DpnI domain-containing protein [Acidobacteriaceae bacterium]
MDLICDPAVAFAYKSPLQRARVISEHWFQENSYCLACDSERLSRAAANTMAMDFSCDSCGHRYELKTFTRRPPKSLVDGAYAALMSRIRSGSAPTLCLLERNESWCIRSLTAIHSSFLTSWVIEQRPPLPPHARRAGWIGCKIRLDRIPPDGEIAVIDGGISLAKSEVRRSFKRFLPLATLSADQRGWTTLTLAIVRSLAKSRFCLSDLYAREEQFAAIYPGNRHVRAKIRQQLQVLRDIGVVVFEGGGAYRLTA